LSNLLKSSGKTAFAEFTATLPPARNAQWSRIVAAGANNRLCMIFKDRDEASKWIDQMSTAVPRGEEK
jgi:hypothetical protein